MSYPLLSPRSARTSSTTSSVRRISTPSPERRAYPYASNYFTIGRAMESDTDSSDNFEPFIPPKRSRYASEPFVHQQLLECQRERRASSPFPDFNRQQLKKSSPILTKRPGWFSKRDRQAKMTKHKSEVSLTLANRRLSIEKPKHRSRSVDGNIRSKVSSKPTNETLVQGQHATLCDSDDNTGGTVESKDYSKPFEHILWRKLGLDDGSAISGSLPHLDRIRVVSSIKSSDGKCNGGGNEEDDEDGEGCTYLDPTELEEYCERLGNRELSDRIRKRLSTVLSNTYLSLMDMQEDVTDAPEVAADNPLGATSMPTFCEPPSERSSSQFLTMERLRKSGLADSISLSGYSTDASSGFENELDSGCGGGFLGRLHNVKGENQYGDLLTPLSRVACSERTQSKSGEQQQRGEEGEGEEYEQIYEEIDQYSDTNPELKTPPITVEGMALPVPALKTHTLPARHTNLHLTQSVPPQFNWHDQRDGKFTSQVRKESPYATVKEISSQISGGVRRAPTLPPRRVKKVVSMDPSQGRRKYYRRDEPKVPGVSIRR